MAHPHGLPVRRKTKDVLRRARGRLRRTSPKGVVSLRTIAQYLPTRPVVVEAGAHVGVDTAAMARAWRQAKIYAFEPVPGLYEQLELATARLPNVHRFQLALGDRVGPAQLHLSAGSSDGSSSLAAPKAVLTNHPDVVFDTKIDVQVTTLDAWASEHGVPRIDFLWLDVQGHELRILTASPRMLEGVSVIHAEVHLVEDYDGTPLYDDLRTWLSERGFWPVVERIDWFDGGNVLFARDTGRERSAASRVA